MSRPAKLIVDARDVLDPNARTSCAFRARTRGYFRRMGPNRWDDYELVPVEENQVIEVLPGLKIQLEAEGVAFRMRYEDQVVQVEWLPADDDQIAESNADQRRTRFVEQFIESFDEAQGRGAAGVIAVKLRS